MIVTHYGLGAEFLQALRLIVPDSPTFYAVSLEPDAPIDEMRAKMREALGTADQGEGVLVLTDMFGGTPSNLALSSLVNGKIDVIGGVNLPMLIHLAQIRSDLTLTEAVQAASDAGKRYIRIGSQVMSRSK